MYIRVFVDLNNSAVSLVMVSDDKITDTANLVSAEGERIRLHEYDYKTEGECDSKELFEDFEYSDGVKYNGSLSLTKLS